VSPKQLQLTVYGISDGLMTWLQSVQNAAARLVSGAQRYDHITPVLHQLHWLPVRKRMDFKIAALVYRSLSGMAPAYLAVWLSTVSCRLKKVVVSCALPTRGLAMSGGSTGTSGPMFPG